MEIKPQDIIFLLSFLPLLFLKSPKLFVYAALICFILAAPLFGMFIFFTAQRLVWYGLAYITLAVVLNVIKYRNG